ncbi:MAG TPA: hypothetical protein VF920_12515 [Dongiaceae bacterium]
MVSNVSSYSESIAKAFLPSQGMRFEGATDARVHDWQPAKGGAGTAAQRAAAMQLPGTYPNSTTINGTAGANGTISGGLLRPGAIDQSQFKAMLSAASLGVPGAGQGQVTGRPPMAPVAALTAQGLRPVSSNGGGDPSGGASDAADSAIQTLSPAQFAALTGGSQLAGVAPVAAAASSGQRALPADIPTAFKNLPPDTLTLTDAAIPPDGAEATTAATAAAATTDQTADRTTGDQTPIGTTDKNGVLVLNQIPDRDTRREYAAKGIKWKIVDDPAANKLFFGPDGKFGWDDVADLINPLQHIPLVNIVYRHLTGDQINGSAELLGAIPFGPLGALSAIADLAVRSTTGKDIGENAIAMLTGGPDTTATDLAAAKSPAQTTVVASVDANPYPDRETGHS